MKLFIFIFLISISISFHAEAHKVTGSLWTVGDVIEGEIGFSNGNYAQEGTLVQVLDEAGNEIGTTEIKDEGLFRFKPTQKIKHFFKADLSAGHVANLEMDATDVPIEGDIKEVASASEPSAQVTTQPSDSELSQMIAKAVRKEVQPLRKEIALYKEKNDLQTILGGLGYILGLTGIVMFIMARREKSKNGT